MLDLILEMGEFEIFAKCLRNFETQRELRHLYNGILLSCSGRYGQFDSPVPSLSYEIMALAVLQSLQLCTYEGNG
jgi:hypothetical protein